MQTSNVKACCADLYQSDLARLILGDTLHPGGLALTHHLGKLAGLRANDWVVDLASGRGTSAVALSRVFHCKVVGVEFGATAVSLAQTASLESPTPLESFFVQADAESPPFRLSSIDAAVCECSMSIFPDKSRVVKEVVQMLRPGGKFGISDITLEPDSLPAELSGILGRVLCLTDALNVEGYVRLLEQEGLVLQHKEDASSEILNLLDSLNTKLGALLAWQSIFSQGPSEEENIVQKAPGVIANLRELVREGRLGYWLFVGRKPGS